MLSKEPLTNSRVHKVYEQKQLVDSIKDTKVIIEVCNINNETKISN